MQCTLGLLWNVHLGFLKILSNGPNIFQTLPGQNYHPPPLYDKIIHSSETFPRFYGARSTTTASLAAATCNDATVYHLSEVFSTAMQLHPGQHLAFSIFSKKVKSVHSNTHLFLIYHQFMYEGSLCMLYSQSKSIRSHITKALVIHCACYRLNHEKHLTMNYIARTKRGFLRGVGYTKLIKVVFLLGRSPL